MLLQRITRIFAATTLLVPPLLVGFVGPGLPTAAAAVPPVANPPIAEGCGITTTLVLDASGSVSSSGAVEDVRHAADAYLAALTNTNSSARVTQFASLAQELAPSTVVTPASLASNGVLRNAVNKYYNPIPPRPSTTNIYSYRSGNPLVAGSYQLANSSNQYTNWDQSLDQAGETTPDLVVYVTDGDPTSFDFDQPGDPFRPSDVAVSTDRSTQAEQVTLDRAVEEANQIKNQGSRMLAIGVGAALSNPASQARLEQIAGPQVVENQDLANVDSINDIDVALVTDFEDLASLMRGVVLELCSPSLTIRKMAQTSSDATYAPTSGWPMTVTPTVPGGNGFRWILPAGATGPNQTVNTNADGFAQFQWEPDPPEANSAANVQEAVRAGYTAGRPNAPDYLCEFKDRDGNVRNAQGDFANPNAPTFDLNPIAQEIVTCTVYNSFNYAPAIVLTKSNAPTSVRGDLNPPAEVTSTFHVTNPGNTPLSNVTVTDDRCGPVRGVPPTGTNQGDTNGNGKLDPGEDWLFRCPQEIQTPASTNPAGQNIVNTAVAKGTDPAGTEVTDNATDDVDAFNPAVSLTKQVNGVEQVTVPAGQQVTYTYRATNEGNAPLGSVSLVDDTPPCTSPTRGADDPGNNDNVLGVGETWTYSCTANPTASVIDTARVTGTPLDPTQGNSPFPTPNPTVTDQDTAEVTVVNPEINLTKTADPPVVLLDPGGGPETVAYTFSATNTGDAPLNRPGATTAGPALQPGWIVDARCLAPATYVSGDVNTNALLDPGETWNFTCQGQITQPTVNQASITGQPSDGTGVPLPGIDPVTDNAAAFVDVLTPGISIIKTAVVPVVLDPDANPVAGPDTPTPRPAEYLYQVTNTGNVPLDLGAGPTDNICAPLVRLVGDTNGDELLDPGEVWSYSCETVLERQQGNTPPVAGAESGLVTNRVDVTGTPFFDGGLVPDKAVTDFDTAQVQVIEPGLTISKTASAAVVRVDTEVTYTFVVTNTGDVGLELIGPIDDKCGALEYLRGDRNNNGLVDGANSGPREQWFYECTRSLGTPEPPETTDINTVAVSAVDPLGNLYVATDNAEVRVISPAIHLEKTVSESLVPVGSTVTYNFDVTNVGTSPVPADDILADVQLGDLTNPPNDACLQPVFISPLPQPQFLTREPPVTWTYRCQGTIDTQTTDVAVVTGHGGTQFDLDLLVADFDTAFVQPFHPAISVVKSATPKVLVGSGEVTYTYEVTNPGDVPLAGVAERITDDTCSPVEYVSGDQDGDGVLDTPNSIFEDALDETWIFTCTTTIDETTTNTVVVTGTPVDGGGELLCGTENPTRSLENCDVDDSDRETVRVVAPASIEIVKETTTSTDARFGFSLDGQEFKLGDGDSRMFDGLAPGDYRVKETPAGGWDLTKIRCTGDTGDVDVVKSQSAVVIGVDEGQSVSCTFTNQLTQELPSGGSTGGIPDTGAPPWIGRMIAVGLLLIVIGAALVYAGRRRTALGT